MGSETVRIMTRQRRALYWASELGTRPLTLVPILTRGPQQPRLSSESTEEDTGVKLEVGYCRWM
jgi:hypothetical protein